ncbi:MAG: 6-pyruvoyl trahydropterin synthase family protein [Planctomycetota bacterium]|jgi:6-pyruvoyltetrahydropterin/6-carboxytetrahydropterin synthase
MFTISVETHFRASHQLTLPDGSKEPIHEHDWLVAAAVAGDKLDEMGVVMDFHVLKAMVEKITAELDNTALGDLRYFRQNNPSAENVAKHVYDRLRGELPKGVVLRCIKVIEEPGCSAEFAE